MNKGSLGWGGLGALVGSLCCLGPAVAILLGLGGAGFVAGLASYRPYFLLASLAIMGGIGLALRRSLHCCSLEEHQRNLWLYPTLALSVFAVGYFLLVNIVPSLIYGWAGASADSAASAKGAPAEPAAMTPQLQVATLEIRGMT